MTQRNSDSFAKREFIKTTAKQEEHKNNLGQYKNGNSQNPVNSVTKRNQQGHRTQEI